MSQKENDKTAAKRDAKCQDEGTADADLGVCQIMGDWGRYQWSLTLFATLYSALTSITVCLGPILTPEMSFLCQESNRSTPASGTNSTGQTGGWMSANKSAECFADAKQTIKCHEYVYDSAELGLMLTNQVSSPGDWPARNTMDCLQTTDVVE